MPPAESVLRCMSMTATGRPAAKTPLSFRLHGETARLLERRAQEAGETQTALVERYVEEGLRTDVHPLVTFRDGTAGRRPCIVGTSLGVWQVVETIRQNGGSIAETAGYLGKPVELIEAAARYYADFTEEIDRWTERANAFAEREEANWRRQQELLG